MTYWTEQMPNGRWKGRVRLGGRGAPVRSKTFDYDYEAELWAAAQDAATADATFAAVAPAAALVSDTPTPAATGPETPTLAVWLETWHAARAGSWSAATSRWYRTHADAIADDRLGGMRLATIKRSDVDRWMTRQVDAGVGAPTINARRKTLAIALGYARAEQLVDYVVTQQVPELPTSEKPDRPLAEEEVARLLHTIGDNHDLRTATLLAVDAGLRWEEVFGLPASAVVTHGRYTYIHVWQVQERIGNRIREYPKGKRRRTVPVTTDRLRDALAVSKRRARLRGPEALLLVNAKGNPVPYEWFRKRVWNGHAHRARLNTRARRVTFHDLRHTYGTRLADAGIPRHEIAALMGHADERTTARYIHAGHDGRRFDLVHAALG